MTPRQKKVERTVVHYWLVTTHYTFVQVPSNLDEYLSWKHHKIYKLLWSNKGVHSTVYSCTLYSEWIDRFWLLSACMGSATVGARGPCPPQFLEKINEFFKFRIDFLIILTLWRPHPPVFSPWRTPCPRGIYTYEYMASHITCTYNYKGRFIVGRSVGRTWRPTINASCVGRASAAFVIKARNALCRL